MGTYMEGLQVLMPSADTKTMEHDHQRMGSAERERHHDDLVTDGYEWCPECGTVLVWDLPSRRGPARPASTTPVVCGDCPPLTAEDLALTVPAPF
jgi:hypothetical protein